MKKLSKKSVEALNTLKDKYHISDKDLEAAVKMITCCGNDGISTTVNPSSDPKFVRYIAVLIKSDLAKPENRDALFATIGNINDDKWNDHRFLDYNLAHWFPNGISINAFLRECFDPLRESNADAVDLWMAINGKRDTKQTVMDVIKGGFDTATTYGIGKSNDIRYNKAVTVGQSIKPAILTSILKSAKLRFVDIDDLMSNGVQAIIGNTDPKNAMIALGSCRILPWAECDNWPFHAVRNGTLSNNTPPLDYDYISTNDDIRASFAPYHMDPNSVKSNVIDAVKKSNTIIAESEIFGENVPPIRFYEKGTSYKSNASYATFKLRMPFSLWKLFDASISATVASSDASKASAVTTFINDSDYSSISDFYNEEYQRSKSKVVLAVFERTMYD